VNLKNVVCPRFCAFAFFLFLAACATAPPQAPLPELKGVPRAFEMTSRLSIRQGDRSDIAKLRWAHKFESDQWVFSSPIGNEDVAAETE